MEIVASVATALSVLVAAWQLRLNRRLALTQFEDSLSAQYREIIRRLPIGALLGERMSDAELRSNLAAFYHYFDLSNEQAFLHRKHRVSKTTWADWAEGIQQNLRRPAFRSAWLEISARSPESFDELKEEIGGLVLAPVNATRST